MELNICAMELTTKSAQVGDIFNLGGPRKHVDNLEGASSPTPFFPSSSEVGQRARDVATRLSSSYSTQTQTPFHCSIPVPCFLSSMNSPTYSLPASVPGQTTPVIDQPCQVPGPTSFSILMGGLYFQELYLLVV